MIAVVDKVNRVSTISGVKAYTLNKNTGIVELYISKKEKKSIDTHRYRVLIKDGNAVLDVFWKGKVCL